MVEKLVAAVKKLVAAWSKISRAGWKIGQCMIEKLLAAFNFFNPKKRKLHGRRMVKKLVAAVKKLVAALSKLVALVEKLVNAWSKNYLRRSFFFILKMKTPWSPLGRKISDSNRNISFRWPKH